MKILHLLSQRPDSTGSGFYVREIIRESHRNGHTNYLVAGITADDTPDLSDVPVDAVSFFRFESDELPFAIPGMSDVMPYPSTRFGTMTQEALTVYRQQLTDTITRAAKTYKPDLIHTNHLWIMTALTRHLFPGIPMVTSSHGTDLRQLINCPHLRDEVVASCQQVDRVIALSKRQKEDISKLYSIPGERITIAGSGFNQTLFSPAQKPDPSPVRIVYAGKLSNAKGVPWLLEAMQIVSNNKTPCHLYLAGSGSGPEKDRCLALAAELQDRVTVCGALTQPALADLLKTAHIFVLPSFYEGLPLVLFEALASGCRVITTALAGALEIAGENDHNLIRFIELPPLETVDAPFESDMPMLKQRLAMAIEDEIRRASQEPDIRMDHVRALTHRYTWPSVFNRIEQVYEAIVRT